MSPGKRNTVLAGFALSALVGVPFGLLMGMSPGGCAALNPIVSIIRPLPALSWIPLSMLWLGIDEQQKYAIVFMGSFASVLVYTTDATLRVDQTLPRPRSMDVQITDRFIELKREVWDLVQEEVMGSMTALQGR